MGGRARHGQTQGPRGAGTSGLRDGRGSHLALNSSSEHCSPIHARGFPPLFTGIGQRGLGSYAVGLTLWEGLGWLRRCPVTGRPSLFSEPIQCGL